MITPLKLNDRVFCSIIGTLLVSSGFLSVDRGVKAHQIFMSRISRGDCFHQGGRIFRFDMVRFQKTTWRGTIFVFKRLLIGNFSTQFNTSLWMIEQNGIVVLLYTESYLSWFEYFCGLSETVDCNFLIACAELLLTTTNYMTYS